MIHRTFRSLDDAPKLVGFTIRQWAALIAGSAMVLAIVHVARLGAKPAITLCVFAIGLPAALTYVSESGGLQLGVLLGDMCRWRLSAKRLVPASPADRSPRGTLIAATSEQGEDVRAAAASRADDEALWGRWQ